MSGFLSGRPHRHFLGLGILIAVSPALVGCIWGWYCAHPVRQPRAPDDTPAQWGIPFEEVELSTADGLALAAWYTPPNNEAVILVGHGFAAGRLADFHALLARHDYGVLSWDFRAHGSSEGRLCSVGYFESRDVEAALDFTLGQPGVEWIGAWGGSMGGMAAIFAAAERPEIRAVVADSAPHSAVATLEVYVQPRILQPFFRYSAERALGISLDQIRPVDQIGEISPRPVYIIQGTADSQIPEGSAHLLYAAADEPRILWLEPGSDHLELHEDHPEEYESRVIAFFDAARRKDDSFPVYLQEELGRPVGEAAGSP
jgi:fermentation-respiration switch protein FrsA (DUF1100 family)